MGRRLAFWTSIVMVVGVGLFSGGVVAASEYQPKGGPGPHQVAVLDGEWIDADRGGRDVPYRVYYPHGGADPSPVVVWSHGGGGSREGSEFLGRHLASHGYAAFHIQHRGSDIDAVRGDREGLQRAVLDPVAAVDRFRDVPFAVARIEAMQLDGPLAGRLDTGSIGMSGH
jgi:predicted dienelactone hydrolase